MRSSLRFQLAYAAELAPTASIVGAAAGVVGSSIASYGASSAAASSIARFRSKPSWT